MKPTDKPKPLNKILEVIHSELITWFGILSLIFLGIFAITFFTSTADVIEVYSSSTSLEGNIFCGTFNSEVYKLHLTLILILLLAVLAISMIMISGKPKINESTKNNQMILFMFICTTMLCIYIFFTGGFLDSPFSPALSIYLAGFLLLQDRQDLQRINRIIISFTAILIISPYFLYAYFNSKDIIYFFDYSKNDVYVLARMALTLILALWSLYIGQRINDKIATLYG